MRVERAARAARAATVCGDAAALAGAVAVTGFGASITIAAVLCGLLLYRAVGAHGGLGGVPGAREARSAAFVTVGAGFLLASLAPVVGIAPQSRVVAAASAGVILVAIARTVVCFGYAMSARRLRLIRPALLVGDGVDAGELLANMEAWPDLPFDVVGVCADTEAHTFGHVPVLGRARACALVARDLGVRTVMIAPAALGHGAGAAIRAELLEAGIAVILIPNITQIEAARLSSRQLGGLPVLTVSRRDQSLRNGCKRGFDFIVSASLLAVLSPLLLAVAAAVRLDTAGPVLFRQSRIGRHGTAFTMWKFRTMRPDAEALLAELRASTGAHREPGTKLFKKRDDPRITQVGRWLRRASIDELPQLWNVLIGEMSLVGPRPALGEEVATFDDLTLRRLGVKPGITGLWQTSGRSDASFLTYSRLDAFYADNWTLAGDARILLKTIPAVVGARGAY